MLKNLCEKGERIARSFRVFASQNASELQVGSSNPDSSPLCTCRHSVTDAHYQSRISLLTDSPSLCFNRASVRVPGLCPGDSSWSQTASSPSARFQSLLSCSTHPMEGLSLQHQHGKAKVRVARRWRGASGQHRFVEWSVSISITSHVLRSFTEGDNSSIVATDSIKNTVYALAKECKQELSAEDFAVYIGQHFVRTYPKIVTGSNVKISEKQWERVSVDGTEHDHGFKLGTGKHVVEAIVDSAGHAKVTSGLTDFTVLKTTQSGFEKFVRDKYTVLPDTSERMLATVLTANWSYSSKPADYQKHWEGVKTALMDTFYGPAHTGVYSPSVQYTLLQMAKSVITRFPEIESVHLSLPNVHFLPVNLPTVGVKFENDVYLPTDEPHGSIEARLSRKDFIPTSKL